MSPQNAQFWNQYQQAKLKDAYNTYVARNIDVYSSKDPSERSKRFMSLCKANNICPDVMEMHVRSEEGWLFDEYEQPTVFEFYEMNGVC